MFADFHFVLDSCFSFLSIIGHSAQTKKMGWVWWRNVYTLWRAICTSGEKTIFVHKQQQPTHSGGMKSEEDTVNLRFFNMDLFSSSGYNYSNWLELIGMNPNLRKLRKKHKFSYEFINHENHAVIDWIMRQLMKWQIAPPKKIMHQKV